MLPHHAGAIAVVAVLDFGARLTSFAVTPRAGVLDVDRDLLVDTLGGLSERQLHHKLENKNREGLEVFPAT